MRRHEEAHCWTLEQSLHRRRAFCWDSSDLEEPHRDHCSTCLSSPWPARMAALVRWSLGSGIGTADSFGSFQSDWAALFRIRTSVIATCCNVAYQVTTLSYNAGKRWKCALCQLAWHTWGWVKKRLWKRSGPQISEKHASKSMYWNFILITQ